MRNINLMYDGRKSIYIMLLKNDLNKRKTNNVYSRRHITWQLQVHRF